jgi:hypothetical protein
VENATEAAPAISTVTLAGRQYEISPKLSTPRHIPTFWGPVCEVLRNVQACGVDEKAINAYFGSLAPDDLDRLLIKPAYNAIRISAPDNCPSEDDFLDSAVTMDELLMAWPIIAKQCGILGVLTL